MGERSAPPVHDNGTAPGGWNGLRLGNKVVWTHRAPISRNATQEFEAGMSLGQRVADRVAAVGGSWTFVLLFGATLVAWIVVNASQLAVRHAAFDPYPFVLLNLLLSTLNAIQAPIILMSQNRQAARDRADAAHDYEVNLKAELEIGELRAHIDELRAQQWETLIALQHQQLDVLAQLRDERNVSGISPHYEPDRAS